MTDPQTSMDKTSTVAAGISASVQEAAQQAQPAFERLADRLTDSISDMAQHSREAAIETRKLLAQKTQQATSTAEHCIQQAPFKSVLIAASVGAVAATLVSWLVRPRDH